MKKYLLALFCLFMFFGCSLFETVGVEIKESGYLCPGEDCTFTAVITGTENVDFTYSWEIEGVPVEEIGNTISFTPPVDGLYEVSVKVSRKNNTVSADKTINIPNPNTFEYNKSKAMMGDWLFLYTIISTFANKYYFTNLSTSYSSSDWNAFGEDEYGDSVIAGYSSLLEQYSLLDSGTIIDRYFVYDVTGDTITGDYYQIDNDTEEWSRAYPLTGSKIADFEYGQNLGSRNSSSFVVFEYLVGKEADMGFSISPAILSSYLELKERGLEKASKLRDKE